MYQPNVFQVWNIFNPGSASLHPLTDADAAVPPMLDFSRAANSGYLAAII